MDVTEEMVASEFEVLDDSSPSATPSQTTSTDDEEQDIEESTKADKEQA